MLKPKRLYIVNFINSFIPPTSLYKYKAILFRWAGVHLEKNVRIVSSVKIIGNGRLLIGENTFIGHETKIFMGGSEVLIGRNVDISSMVTIINGSHEPYTITGKAAGKGASKKIIINDGAWVCANVTLIGGANVGRLTIVAAGAVVTKKLKDNVTYVGGGLRELKESKEANSSRVER